MLNLVKTRPGIVADPDSGEALRGAAWLGRYSRVFVRGLMRRGGHPLFVGRKVGGYIDACNTPAGPGRPLFGTMRYRGRRDLIHMAGDPPFRALQPATLPRNDAPYSFPAQRHPRVPPRPS